MWCFYSKVIGHFKPLSINKFSYLILGETELKKEKMDVGGGIYNDKNSVRYVDYS